MAKLNRFRLVFEATTLAALVILTFPVASRAQVTGTISGYITDPTGAAVPGAKVTTTLVLQSVSRTTESSTEGSYDFPALLPGTYTLTVEKAGFQVLKQTEVVLTVNQNLRVDVTLKVGAVTEAVTVTAEAPLVDTRSPTLSGLVDDRRVVDLPLNGRNVIALARILPGVLNVNAPQQLSDARSGPEMDVNGGRPNMNLFTFNGAYFMNPSRNTGMNYPPPDAIQEFRILSHNYTAEYGRNPGSQVNVVSKAGSNDFHGSVWEFLRNNSLNTRGFFLPRVPGIKQNQFGFSAGGPIRRNKLFAFGSYQGLTDHREASTVVATLPSDAHRSGDFTDLLPDVTLTSPVDPLTGQPFRDSGGNLCVQDNVILPSCISPVTKNLLPFLPSLPAGGDLVSLAANPRRGDLFMVRLDFNWSPKHTIFGHFFSDSNNRSNPFEIGNVPGYMNGKLVQSTRNVALNDTYVFSPRVVNQFTASYLLTKSNDYGTESRSPESLGMNLPNYPPTGAPDFNVGDLFYLGSVWNARFVSNNWQFRDALSWMRGRHNFKFGGEFMDLQFLQDWIGPTQFYFSGSRSGDPVADFLLGAYDNLFLNFGQRLNDARGSYGAFFFQDEFKVNPRFTLTYGVRYEYFAPWYDDNDRIDTVAIGKQSQKVPDAPPGILFPGDPGVPRGLVPGDKNNFGPRLGFAWDLRGDGKTSIRGGYGVFYESVNGDSLAQENPPFAGFSTAYNGTLTDPYGSVGLTAPPASPTGEFGCVSIPEPPGLSCDLFPLPVGGVLTDLSLRTPYVQSFNLSIQRQLTPDIMLEAAYAGKIGIKVEALRTYNPARFIPGTVYDPVSGLENMLSTPENINDRVLFEPGILSPQGFLLGNDFRSWYHSFQTQMIKRFSRGLSVTAAYTLSKSIDSSSTDNLGAPVANPFNLRDERGRSDWDRRHAFVASWLWSPQWKFGEPWRNTLLGGWTFTGIHSIQSGLPLTFINGDDVAVDGTYGDQHAFLTAEPIARSHSSRADMVSQFFNTNAFEYPNCSFVPDPGNPQAIEQQNCTPFGIVHSLLGQYGNAGRGILSGPALNNTDFSIIKDFAFKEHYKVQFRSEFFNVFNQVSFNNPVTRVNSGAFGRIRSAQAGRVIQFALKFMW